MKKKIIIISIAIGALGVTAYFTYPIARDRYFPETKTVVNSQPSASNSATENPPPTETESTAPIAENPAAPKNGSATSPASEEIIGNSIADSIAKNTPPKSHIKANITPTHCADACKAFASDLALLAYCEQTCGISPIKNVSNCDNKKDLEKDYCQKDLAITKTDASLCEPVKDDNIRQTCQNRIAEDVLEKVQSGTDPNFK